MIEKMYITLTKHAITQARIRKNKKTKIAAIKWAVDRFEKALISVKEGKIKRRYEGHSKYSIMYGDTKFIFTQTGAIEYIIITIINKRLKYL